LTPGALPASPRVVLRQACGILRSSPVVYPVEINKREWFRGC